jgi:hypothetical protein
MFERMIRILSLFCLTTGIAWAAESAFLGEWKLDPARTRMPDAMKVERKGDHRYAFDFGGGAETIAVDGTDQPGGYGGTLLSVKPEAPDTWIVERRLGSRLLLRARWKLSQDGSTLADDFRQFGSDGSTAVSMDYVYRRVAGGSGFAADWQSIRETMNSPFPLRVTAFQDDGLAFTTVVERKTQNVKFDGKDYPDEGPGARGASSSAERVDERTLVITEKSGGTVTDTETVALSADLKTLTITVHVPGSDRPNVMVFERS